MRRSLLALVAALALVSASILPQQATAAGTSIRSPQGATPAPPALTCFISFPGGLQAGPFLNVSPALASSLSTVIGALGGNTACF